MKGECGACVTCGEYGGCVMVCRVDGKQLAYLVWKMKNAGREGTPWCNTRFAKYTRQCVPGCLKEV